MGRFFSSLIVTVLIVGFQLGLIGSPGDPLLDEGAPEDAVVYFASESGDIEFVVYPDQIELLGEAVMGQEAVIGMDDVLSVKSTGSRLSINTLEGQMWVELGFLGGSRIRKAADKIREYVDEV